ncbi:DUF6882 domain-containing protein [Corynebacterium sp. H130]|uniref:DUF6882 domain-containing protein n=1 Tax=Corynebacterium sp. H130 TaxID=3133444 RepID=UPI0030967AAE
MIPEIRRVGQHAALVANTKQEMFGEFLTAHLGEEYHWSFDSGVLTFESEQGSIQCDTYPIASIAVDPATLLWRWQPLSEQEAQYFRGEVSGHFREFGEQHGLTTFTSPEVPYEVGEDQAATIAQVGHDIIHAGYEIFGPNAVFYQARFNAAGSRLVWGLGNFRTEAGPIYVPTPDLLDVLIKADRLLMSVDDIGWSMDGLARHFPGVDSKIDELIPGRSYKATYTEPTGMKHEIQWMYNEARTELNLESKIGQKP